MKSLSLNHVIASVVGAALVAVAGNAEALRAVAITGSQSCAIALADEGTGIKIRNANVVAPDCRLASNSVDDESIDVNGTSYVEVESLSAVGDIQISQNSQVVGNLLPLASSEAPDPFGDVLEPAVPASCDFNKYKAQDGDVLVPGVYCDGIKVQGDINVTFQPGVYVLVDGNFKVRDNPTLTGTDVTFIFQGNSPASVGNLSMIGEANVNLAAPTSGDFDGILFFQSRDASQNGSDSVLKVSNGQFDGAFYSKNRSIDIGGQVDGCVGLVADRIEVNSDAQVNYQCGGEPPDCGIRLCE